MSLAKIVDERIAFLDNNFKYNVLKNSNHILDFKIILNCLERLRDQQELIQVNNEVDNWADSLDIQIPEIHRATFNKDLDFAMILILDELIIRTLNSSNNFSDLEPVVFLEKENDSIAFFFVTLNAKDSLFLPEVFLELPTGKFPILVDDQTGLAHFSMRKKNKDEKKSFKGRIIYMKDMHTKQVKEFEYPSELLDELDLKSPI